MSKSGIQVGIVEFPGRGTTFHFYTETPGDLPSTVQVYFSEKLQKVRVFVGDKEWKEPHADPT